jgi:hypothetical protein
MTENSLRTTTMWAYAPSVYLRRGRSAAVESRSDFQPPCCSPTACSRSNLQRSVLLKEEAERSHHMSAKRNLREIFSVDWNISWGVGRHQVTAIATKYGCFGTKRRLYQGDTDMINYQSTNNTKVLINTFERR